MDKIPLDQIKIGTKVLIKNDAGSKIKTGMILSFEKLPDHYSNIYTNQPCFNNNWCSVEYEIIKSKKTIII